MSFKAKEPTADALGLFPKGANTKPKEGEIQPSEFFKFEAGMNRALAQTSIPRILHGQVQVGQRRL